MKNAVNLVGKIFLVVIFLIAVLTAHVNALAVTDNLSVDAIAVYSRDAGGQGNIYYSFFGHSPKIPKPVNTSFNWKWWTLAGDNVPASSIPNPIAGDHRQPSIAFSREGFAVAVWENFRQAGTINCADVPDPVYRGDILFSVWNGTNWSDAAIAIAGANDTILKDAAIAIDSNGNGLILYTKQVVTRNAGCPGDSIYSVEYGRFQGFTKSFFAEGTLDGPAANAPILAGSEAAFTSKLLAPGLFTGHQAVAAWWSNDTVYSKNCTDASGNQFQVQIPTFWPKKAIWNGTSFGQVDFIPDKLIPPPDLTDNLSVLPGKKLGISSDQFDHAKVVWGIKKQSGDPCPPNLPNVSNENLNARWNGTEWDKRAAIFDTLIGGPRGIDIAYLPGNDAISVYDDFDPNLIKWSVESANAIWITRGQLDSGNGFDPTVASLAHNRTVAIWVNAGQIMWSNITNDKIGTGSWSPAQVLAAGGGQPDIAAHTGSPTLPHAEWTFAVYQASDIPDHQEGSRNNHRNEMIQVGSTNLVNILRQQDKNSNHMAHRSYLKLNTETQLENIGNINSATSEELSNFIGWSAENYPSKRSILVTSEHGFGWRGLCWDYNPVHDDPTNLTELRSGLSDAGKHFDIVLMHNCLMAMVETAYEIKDFTDFIGFSQETHLSNNYAYNVNLRNLTENPFTNTIDLAALIVDNDKAANLGQHPDGATFSVINTSRVANLANKVDAFAKSMLNNLSFNNVSIRAALASTQRMSENSYIDLYHFAERVNNSVTDNDIKNNASEVMKAINDTILKSWFDAPKTNAHGISIYLENNSLILNPLINDYNATKFGKDTKWLDFLKAFSNSSIIRIRLESFAPLFLFAQDSSGRNTGGIFSSLRGGKLLDCGPWASEIPGSSYSDYGFKPECNCQRQDVFLPVYVANFTWFVNGSLLAQNATFNLTIQKIENDAVTLQQNISGKIQPDETISGVFTPAQDIISRYDSNSSGRIERSEAVRAVLDFFSGLITRQEAIVVVLAFFGG